MTPQQVINHFGGTVKKTAESLDVSQMAIYKWLKAGKVPKNRQYELQVRTGGILKAEETNDA